MARVMGQRRAAELGFSDRQVRRLLRRYEDEGRGGASGCRLTVVCTTGSKAVARAVV